LGFGLVAGSVFPGGGTFSRGAIGFVTGAPDSAFVTPLVTRRDENAVTLGATIQTLIAFVACVGRDAPAAWSPTPPPGNASSGRCSGCFGISL
jgi:hypothetical protein